jgi:hypothetical protein
VKEDDVSFWRFDSKVGLKGVEGTLTVADDCYGRKVYTPNPTNPAVLTDDVILYALRTSRRARLDFNRIFPTLLPDEQARLTTLIENNPRISTLNMDDNTFHDRIQSNDIRMNPIRTVGKRGGIGFGRQ